jgi:large subunit ribosomal protein L4
MAVATYTKSGTKNATAAKLDNRVFGQEVKSHHLLKEAYLAYMANGRTASAVTKTRGQVSGGGRKPWRQKGMGRARFGSSRNPIWTGGGVAFGPTGQQNYKHQMSTRLKRQALRQALSLAAKEDRLKVVEALNFMDGKTKTAASFLNKIGTSKNILLVYANQEEKIVRSVGNLPRVKTTLARQLNVFDLLNADFVVIDKPALEEIQAWLTAANLKGKSK